MSSTAQPRGGDAQADWEPMLLPPVTPAVAHLDDDGLRRALNRAEHKHVAECGWCRERQRIALSGGHDADAADGTDAEFEQALDGAAWEDSFRRVAVDAVLPSKVRRLMTVHPIPDSVAGGQLWRLTWKARHLLAVVIAVNGWQVLVAPVTTDDELADELTLLVPADRSPVDVELAVRVRQRVAIPLFVLDRYLGALPPVGQEQTAAAEVLDALVRAHRSGSSNIEGATVGRHLFADDADAIAFADALAEEAAWFAAATQGLHYLPAEMPEGGREDASIAAPSLAELITGSKLTLSQLIERTGLSAGRLIDLRRGSPASQEEVRAVASVTGSAITSATGVDAPAFNAAMAEVSAPRWRPARAAWTRENLPEGDPDDPTVLVERLLHERLAARSVPNGQLANDGNAVHAYWRDRVAIVLAGFL